MACRRQQSLLQDLSDRPAPNSMDQLTFKYMKMRTIDSSTDSDSEISPMCSDTSTRGCVSSAPESGTSPQVAALTPKSTLRHVCYSLFLDPYDGSSEDSDEANFDHSVSSRQTRQQGKSGACCTSCRRRRPVLHHPAALTLSKMTKNEIRHSLIDQPPTIKYTNDVQMKCGSDSELWDCDTFCSDRNGSTNLPGEKGTYPIMQTTDTELQLDDSGFQTRASTFHTARCQLLMEGGSCQMVSSCSERSSNSCNLGSLFKRKVGLPGAETVETGPRKRQCVGNMENQHEASNY